MPNRNVLPTDSQAFFVERRVSTGRGQNTTKFFEGDFAGLINARPKMLTVCMRFVRLLHASMDLAKH